MARTTVDDYLRAYADNHTHPVNRALHMVAIPAIVASILAMPFLRRASVGLFAAGWALQFAGHAFEQKRPSFARDPRYLAVGPLWAVLEWSVLLSPPRAARP